MQIPSNLQPLVDADILRYEIGYAAETGWRARTGRDDPPFSYAQEMLQKRLADICSAINTNKKPKLYFTSGKTFRYDIAKRKPYKGTRIEKKPFQFDNLTVYLRDIYGAEVVTGIEADDRLAIDHCSSNGSTILCSRDKDLKQVPGYFYSWELDRQPSWGPALISKEGDLKFTPANSEKKRPAKLTGTGLSWFYAQMLIGDQVDNVPGCPGWGPVAAYAALKEKTIEEQLQSVQQAYREAYGPIDPCLDCNWEEELLEQGKLVWLVRQLDQNGTPITWVPGMTE